LKTNEVTAADGNRSFKKSVVAVYETNTFRSFLKDALHPGGLDLTRRVGEVARVDEKCVLLDVACGKGESIFLLVEECGCSAVGLDLSATKIADAQAMAVGRKHAKNSSFLVSDAEKLPFADAVFDVVLSECSFSVLPSKKTAAAEIARVLKPGGRLVMTDMVLMTDKNSMVTDAYVPGADFTLPCIGGALPTASYVEIFKTSGLGEAYIEDHSKELKKIGYQMGMIFGGWREFLEALSSELRRCSPGEERTESLCCKGPQAKTSVPGRLGYVLIRMIKP
jgi:arsenite methyltransferase